MSTLKNSELSPSAREGAAAPARELTVDDMDNLRHMLGVSARDPRGYRNYFVAGGGDVTSMERLREHGLVVKSERYRLSEAPCYHATEKGAKFVGLEKLPK